MVDNQVRNPKGLRDMERWVAETACGGGVCEWAEGTWFPCVLHWRELQERPAEPAKEKQ